MGKVKPQQIPRKDFYKLLDEFYSIITLLESKEEVKNFFKELLSSSEALMVARRIQIAKMLLSGHLYHEIRESTHASFTTIATVQRWVDGGWGGYLKAVENFDKKMRAKESEEAMYHNDSFSRLKRKYPAHFLISNALEDLKKWNTERQRRQKKRNI